MRTLLLGLDAFDPVTFERLLEEGRMPHLGRYVQGNGYAHFAVADPPQSEVSWTSIATGLNPGGHGLFDFVHRDPGAYALNISLLPTQQRLFGTQFVPPYSARTIFDQATRQGFPATALWWPAAFPARPDSPVRTLPGLGAPDIQGRLGIGVEFRTDAAGAPAAERKTPVALLERRGSGRYCGVLEGPLRQQRKGVEAATLEFELELTDTGTAQMRLDRQQVELAAGSWSPIFQVSFRMGRFVKVQAITRAILTQTHPEVKLYFLPLQIHPLHSPWRYGTPGSFVKDSWRNGGPFLTLGWPQDTIGLEDGCISDEQFLDLCTSVFAARERVFMHHLDYFDEGILAVVFDTLDRVQHMFRRDRPDIVEEWYQRLDALVGRTAERLDGRNNTRLIVVSDHGFTDFAYKVHLNRWLVEQGYLVLQEGAEDNSLQAVDWARSRAYAVGLNSLYLNVQGREGEGYVPAHEVDDVARGLREALLRWRGPDGSPVVRGVRPREEAFNGPLAAYGPDLVVGYAPGYRASSQTGLGEWRDASIEPNTDHWSGDHCIDSRAVPGVLFANRDLGDFPHPSYQDIPALAIGEAPDVGGSAPPPSASERQGDEKVRERLKSLGYL